ncbi:MAG: hypothetical protein IT374_28560 [Polyangiaceae bacterium]|nr:hypothetical protein [Polyangiaceae bacterium]
MTGLWDQPGVPHKGWRCVGMEDLEEPTGRCEMCGREEIRYVHFMDHDDHPTALEVGCVCAEKMEDDLVGPRRRERGLLNQARRRRNWVTRQWRTSAKGNLTLNTDGRRFVVRLDGRHWKAHLLDGERWLGGRKRFDSEEAAKLALFDFVFPVEAPTSAHR